MIADIQSGKEFEVVCSGFNKGGLTSELGSYTVFVPAREIRMGYVKELDKYVGKKLRLRLIEIKTERRKEIINIDSFEWQLFVKSTERSIQKYQITRAAGARTKNPKPATIPRHISYL